MLLFSTAFVLKMYFYQRCLVFQKPLFFVEYMSNNFSISFYRRLLVYQSISLLHALETLYKSHITLETVFFLVCFLKCQHLYHLLCIVFYVCLPVIVRTVLCYSKCVVETLSCFYPPFVWACFTKALLFALPEKDEQQHCAETWYPRMHLAGDPEDNKVPGADSENATAY